MTIQVRKWGNALAVRLPKAVVKRFQLSDGSSVKVLSGSIGIVIRPEKRIAVPSLRELMRLITSTNRPALVDWDKRRGREVW